jgi:hypothetical protein
MKSIQLLAAAAALMLTTQPVHAEATAREFADMLRQGGQDADTARVFIHAVGNGLGWANTAMAKRGDQRLFCVPNKLGLTVDQSVDIFSRFLKENPKAGEYPGGMVMLIALETTFPCPK